MKCPNCNKKIKGISKFCGHCGKEIKNFIKKEEEKAKSTIKKEVSPHLVPWAIFALFLLILGVLFLPTKVISYQTEVPYITTEQYTVEVPYEDVEGYVEKVPYETKEQYVESIPIQEQQEYLDKV